MGKGALASWDESSVYVPLTVGAWRLLRWAREHSAPWNKCACEIASSGFSMGAISETQARVRYRLE